MSPRISFNIRFKMLIFVVGILAAFLFLNFLLLRNLHQVAKTADEITTDILPMKESFYRSRLALYRGLGTLDDVVLEVKDPEEFDRVREFENRLRKTMINFNIFIKAIMWGSESEGFRKDSGGLTRVEWQRQELEHRLTVVNRASPDMQQLARQADFYYVDFSDNAIKTLKSYKKVLRFEWEGQMESADSERRQMYVYRDNAEKYFEFIEEVFRQMDQVSDMSVAVTLTHVQEAQKRIFLWTGVLSGVFVFLIIGFCLIFTELVIVRPVRDLAEGARKIGEGDFATRVKIVSHDEIGQLAGTVNRMAEGLQKTTVSWGYLESVLESANDAFISIDEKGSIISWNRQAEKIFGWPRLEVTGKLLAEVIIPHQHREAHTRGMKRFLETKEGSVLGKTLELTALHRDAREFSVELTIWPIQTKQGYQFNAFLRDITECKKAQEQLQKAYFEIAEREKSLRQTFSDLQAVHETLKQAQVRLTQSERLASIGQLAAGIAHEINNPVGFIGNNLEMFQTYAQNYLKVAQLADSLKKEIENGNMEKAKALIEEFNKFTQEIDLEYMNKDVGPLLKHSLDGVERVKNIVADLKMFAREGMTDTIESLKVEEVIDNVLNIVHNELKYKAELIKDYGDTPLVKGSPPRLGQVFMNLLVNAAQAMEQRGTISVKTYQRDGHLCVDIADTGKGIPPENIAKIFDPFFTTKPVGQGTGLGLSVSYEIVQKHGGKIEVQSQVGKGTTFTVMLPV